MKGPTLVILAAGMGSRYGGLKQLDPVGVSGEIIMDYSVYDAIRAGFSKVIFLIRKSMEQDFREKILPGIEDKIECALSFQEMDAFLPENYKIPEERKKPWGTAHALLCCKDEIDGPFAMINADDFYGKQAFKEIKEALDKMNTEKRPMEFFMVGYLLGNTVTDKGKVARGVCVRDGKFLNSIVERKYVVKTPEGPAYSTDEGKTLIHLSDDNLVSMNFWGFGPGFLEEIEKRLPAFFNDFIPQNPKEEFYVPTLVGELLAENLCTVEVLETQDKWYGVTYKEDKPFVEAGIRALVNAGKYPEKLWESRND